MRNGIITFCIGVVLCACATHRVYHHPTVEDTADTDNAAQTLFLIGGRWEHNPANIEVIKLLSSQLRNSQNASLLFLGDNFTNAESIMSFREALSGYFNDTDAKVYLTSGDKDWKHWGRFNRFSADDFEDAMEQHLSAASVVLPENGCPGPVEVDINKTTVLLMINTQWWLHQMERPGLEEGCDVSNQIEFLDALKDAVLRNHNKKIIVAGHHALYASGARSGKFNFKSHIFPVKGYNNTVHVPLIGVGTLYTWYRQMLGNTQDLHNPEYKRMIRLLRDVFENHDNLIYVAGHEQSLEYHVLAGDHFINSGAIGDGSAVNPGQATFASSNSGFARIDFAKSGETTLSFWSPEVGDRPVYRRRLLQSDGYQEPQQKASGKALDFTDSVITTFATRAYLRDAKRPGMLGHNYRKEWATPIKDVPLFDIGHRKGGLVIDEKGGGMQTKSLKLKESDGKEWGLRSIVKYPENAVPEALRGTIAENVIKEQISAAHPYAAFVVPPLADAAGVYHTNPELVYLPDDPRLGIYRKEFGNALYLFEERPDGARKDVASFGRPEDIISTEDVIDEIIENGNNYVNQEMVLRARLFDILIGDWDRHEDQWRWAQFEYEDGVDEYRPIPRDRDNVFFCSDGWLMDIATHRWGIPKFQGFHHSIRDVAGMNFNARHFDRTFLTRLDRQDWEMISRDLQSKMTDKVIETSIKQFPEEIYELHGEEIIAKLKSRRDALPDYALEYYLFLAKNVDVLGSEKNDLFKIERLNDEETSVTIYEIKEDTEEIEFQYYQRIFRRSETNEIRLYGFDDEDVFVIEGNVNKAIKVRIIGGDEDDRIIDRSNVSGWSKKTYVYDTEDDTELVTSSETRDKTSDKDPLINRFDRKSYKYNLAAPLVFGGYNPDDGIFTGIGGFVQTQGFRKSPFKNQHFFTGIIAPRSGSFNIDYAGTFKEAILKWDANLNAGIYYPSYSNFFYGFGNETEFDEDNLEDDVRFYAARYQQILLNPELSKTLGNGNHVLSFGTHYRYINVKSTLNTAEDTPEQDRFIIRYERNADHEILDVPRHFLAGYFSYDHDTRNNPLYPQYGIHINSEGGYEGDVDGHTYDVDYWYAGGSLSTYYTFGSSLRTTLAIRGGGRINLGKYEFYQSNTLGGNANLRGYRKQRFSGDNIVFQNTDLRIRLFKFWSTILPGEVGLVAFHDIGRVWHENDPSVDGNSTFWHRGYGGGIYIAPLRKAAITMDYAETNTGASAFFVRLGFLF